jgi:lactate dehydrogenase-like 2-hydroxyacid dehydrogenase
VNAVEILLPEPVEPLIEPALKQRFVVHRLWEAADPDALVHAIGGRIRGVVGGRKKRIDAALMSRLPALEIIAKFGVGYDAVDIQEAVRRNIVVTNTPGVLSDEVADLAMGLLIATLRQLPQACNFLREGRWLEQSFPLSGTLRGRSVGIFGLGQIGKLIGRRCEAFGLSIAYHGRHRQPDIAYRYYDSLTEMAKNIDTLIIAAPGGASTRNAVGREVLQALGVEGVVINVGRGSIVDQDALINALGTKTILSVGLDVYADEPRVPRELVDMPQVVLTPHIGSCSTSTFNDMAQLVVDNLFAWFDGKPPPTPVAETPYRRGG